MTSKKELELKRSIDNMTEEEKKNFIIGALVAVSAGMMYARFLIDKKNGKL